MNRAIEAREQLQIDGPQLGQQQRNRGDPGGDMDPLGELVNPDGAGGEEHPGGRVLQAVAEQPGQEAHRETQPEPAAQDDREPGAPRRGCEPGCEGLG